MEKTIILPFGRCSWGRCIFCGYGKKAGRTPGPNEINHYLDRQLNGLGEKDKVKVFGSGSFFDEKQIPRESRRHFIKLLRKKNISAQIESRPEYVVPEKLDEFTGIDLEVAVGLESANPQHLKLICKGFTLGDFERAGSLIRKHGFRLRAYLLVNLPFDEDIENTLEENVGYAKKHADSIVLINLLPHEDSQIFDLWVSGQWSYLSREGFRKLTGKYEEDPQISVDEQTFRFIPRFPKHLRKTIKGVGEPYLIHPYFEVWQDYLIRWYNPETTKHLLFLPCSYTKPYSRSPTHRRIIQKLTDAGVRNQVHEVMLSNAGVIPRQFEDYYPFNDYDWDESRETPEIKKRYVEVTSERIKKYVSTHKGAYEKIICFLKYDSESYLALDKALCGLDVDCVNLLTQETYNKLKHKPRLLSEPEALEDLYLWFQRNSMQ
ncbi:MAG: hypothetical protein GF334_11945 [Candidatus Altiarchaeales archaeon]|nr:hypothetical protein [Candidatus Altiarchaeales archaeon]